MEMMNYTQEQMTAVRTLAQIQMKEGIYLISVPMGADSDQDMLTPWMDDTGRFDFVTDEEAVEFWGEDVFRSFCDTALAYLNDDTVSERFERM